MVKLDIFTLLDSFSMLQEHTTEAPVLLLLLFTQPYIYPMSYSIIYIITRKNESFPERLEISKNLFSE